MKKIVTAIGNPTLNQRLKQEENFEVVVDDIPYQEGILEILEKENGVDFVILSELLPGELDIKQLIETIKMKNASIQIILFLENKKEELENYLYAKGIFAIFYHNQVEVKDVIEIIKNNGKNQTVELKKELEELRKIVLEKENAKANRLNFFGRGRKRNKLKEKARNVLQIEQSEARWQVVRNETKPSFKKFYRERNVLKAKNKMSEKKVICISRNQSVWEKVL